MHDFTELQTFMRIIEAKSLTGAAARLGVTKSVVSRRLASLEDRLRLKLVTRGARGIVPTELGRAYYEQCQRILGELDEATRAITGFHGEACGTLRIAAPMTFGTGHLMPLFADLLREHPGLQMDVDLNDRLVDLIGEGFDLAIRIGILKDSSLIVRKLAPIRSVLAASPAYLARRGEPRRPEELAAHDWLGYANSPRGEPWRFRSGGIVAKPLSPSRLRANNGELLRDAAAAGLGIVALPTFIVGPAIRRRELVPVLAGHPLEEAGLYAVYPPNRHLAYKVRLLVDALAARFAPSPYWDEGLALAEPQERSQTPAAMVRRVSGAPSLK